MNNIPEDVKSAVYKLYDEFEEELSRTPNDQHERIRLNH